MVDCGIYIMIVGGLKLVCILIYQNSKIFTSPVMQNKT